MKTNMTEKKSSHLGIGLAIGTIIGVAAGLFVQSKQGDKLLKEIDKKAAVLQVKLMKQLKGAKKLTKAKYEDLVDEATDYYLKTKDVTIKEVPVIKKYMMNKWKEIEKQLKSK